MSGGSLSEGIVLDMARHMHAVGEVQGHTITVQPGAYYRDMETKTLEKGLLMPSYPASRDICTVGGMVNNNAGGEKTLKYGKTEKYIEALKVVLADGNEYEIKALTLAELAEKVMQRDFEGGVYRQLASLLDTHEEVIAAAKPSVTKNSAGYNLWNIWNGSVFDLTQLFVGSQGTLGITTEITFRLIKPQPVSHMLVIFLKDLRPLSDVIARVLRYGPESFESYDKHTLSLALRFWPQMAAQMGNLSWLRLLWQMLPDMYLALIGGMPQLVLMAEFTGQNEREVAARTQAAQASLGNLGVKSRVTRTPQETRKYWAIRRESFNLLRNNLDGAHTAPFIDDLTVHPRDLPQFLPRLNDILSKYTLVYTIAGHIGDANFHIIPLMNLADAAQRAIIPKLSKEVYDLVFSFKGSMSGEHNDGLIRSHFLPDMYGEEIFELFRQTKQIFDPRNMFNPGKKVGADWAYAEQAISVKQ